MNGSELVAGLTLLLALGVVSGLVENRWGRRARLGSMLQGIVFGGAAVLGMLRPLDAGSEFLVDGRPAIVGLCAFFFGPSSAAVAAAIALAGRMAIVDAVTLADLLVLLASVVIGVVAHVHLKPMAKLPSVWSIYLYAVAIYVVALALMFTPPGGAGLTSAMRVGLPTLILYPLAMALAAMVLSSQIDARRPMEELGGRNDPYRRLPDRGKDTSLDRPRIIETDAKFAARPFAECEQPTDLQFFKCMDRINRAIQKSSNLEDMMSDVLGQVIEIFDCDRAFLLHPCDPEAESWTVPKECTKPEYPGVLALGLKMPMDADVAETFRTLLNSEGPVTFGPGTGHALPEAVSKQFGFKSLISMAVYPRVGKPWQFGIHQCSHARAWTSDERRLIWEIGRRLADTLTSLLVFRDLRESEARFRILVDHATDAFFLHGDDGIILDANRQACDSLGYTADELIGMSPYEFDTDINQSFPEQLRARLRTGEIVSFDSRHRRKDGTVFPVEVRLRPFWADGRRYSVALVRDISERKQAQQQLTLLDFALDHVGEAAYLVDDKARFRYVNAEACRTLGYSRDEFLSMTVSEVDPDFPSERWPAHWHELKTNGTLTFEGRHRTKDGRIFSVEVSANYFEFDGQGYNLALVRDITERKRAEEQVRRTHEDYMGLVNSIDGIVWDADARTFEFTFVSHQAERLLGYPVEQWLREPDFWKNHLHPDDREWALTYCVTAVREKRPHDFEYRMVAADGHVVWLRDIVSVVVENDEPVRVRGIMVDITERRHAEEALRTSETRFRALFENSPVPIWEEDLSDVKNLLDGLRKEGVTDLERHLNEHPDVLTQCVSLVRVHDVNQAAVKLHEADNKEQLLQDLGRILAPGSYATFLRELVGIWSGQTEMALDGVIQTIGGDEKQVTLWWSVVPGYGQTLAKVLVSTIDITGRKKTEATLHRMNRELRAVSDCNQALLRAEDEQSLLNDICRIICDKAGYRMAWVGYAEHDDTKSVRPVAWAGLGSEFLADVKISWADDTEYGLGPAGKAIRSGLPVYVQDVATDPQIALWREAALQHGYRSGIALPIKDDVERAFGVLLIYSADVNAITPDEVRLLEELAGDLAFGVRTQRTRAARTQAEAALRESEQRYRIVADNTYDWEFWTDPDGKFLYNSPSCERITGHPPGAFASKRQLFDRITHPDDRERFARHQNRTAGIGEAEEIEFRIVLPDGRVRHLAHVCQGVHDENGHYLGRRASNRDITERKRAEGIMQARLRLMEFANTHSLDELLQATLDEVEALTASTIGFYHSLDNDQKTLTLQAWSSNTLAKMCTVEGKGLHYSVNEAGVWVDCIRERKPVIHNDYESLPHRKGMPEGHAPVVRQLVVPVFRGDKIVAILGACNKSTDYDQDDVTATERLADFAWDIAEHKRAEEEIGKLFRVVEQSPSTIVITNTSGDIEYVNPRFTQTTGYTREEAIGKNPRILKTDATLPEEYKAMWDTIAQGGVWRGEFLNKRKNGEVYWEAASISPIFDTLGNIKHYVAVKEDITSRKEAEKALGESEAKMRSILDNVGIGVALISPNMEILELNRRMREWFPAIDLGRRPACFRAFNDPPRESPCEFCPTTKTFRDGRVYEAITQTPQAGTVRNYRVVSSPILNASGEVAAAIEMVEDITEQLSLESQLRQSQKMEAVGQLAGGVAHDFNNMLSVILGHTELALMKIGPDESINDDLEEILKAGARSADLTRQLLAFARKQTVVPRVLDLNETVEGMLKMLRRLIGEDIHLSWMPGTGVWPVRLDPSQIDQILANLCVNARDAISGPGKVTIETYAATVDNGYCAEHTEVLPGDYVLLSVSDNGCGMDKETQAKIFEPFYTTKELGEGTGLGLSTVYGIVKQNNGFVNVYSEPGLGATFKIYLPRHVLSTEELKKEDPVVPPARGDETILVAEDEASILNMARLMLEQCGYRVLPTSAPGEAIRIAKEYGDEIQLLITDVVMPEMNGRELAGKVTEFCPRIRCLFMSGYTGNAIAHHGVIDESVNFIQKPFALHALAAKVRDVLDRD